MVLRRRRCYFYHGLKFVNSNIQSVVTITADPILVAVAEIIAVHHTHDNAKSAIPVLQVAKVFGKPHSKTSIRSDNECAVNFANTTD